MKGEGGGVTPLWLITLWIFVKACNTIIKHKYRSMIKTVKQLFFEIFPLFHHVFTNFIHIPRMKKTEKMLFSKVFLCTILPKYQKYPILFSAPVVKNVLF